MVIERHRQSGQAIVQITAQVGGHVCSEAGGQATAPDLGTPDKQSGADQRQQQSGQKTVFRPWGEGVIDDVLDDEGGSSSATAAATSTSARRLAVDPWGRR
jgi:hypothetical protein